MKHILVIVDMQRDFVDGALGSAEAVAIVPAVVEKIRSFDGDIFVTLDTHFDDYLKTAEGRKLPVPHCICGTDGWLLDARVREALDGREYTVVEKNTFGSVDLPVLIDETAGGDDFDISIIGLCTDICVISNALLIKAFCQNVPVYVDASCCAGVSPESHDTAIKAMETCQIHVTGKGEEPWR